MTNISNLNLSKGSIPPLLKYKIVFLGDQAVGKSSIINRFIYDIFDGNEHVKTHHNLAANDWHRLYLAEHIPLRQDNSTAALGYCRTRKIQSTHPQLYQRYRRGSNCVRHNKSLFI